MDLREQNLARMDKRIKDAEEAAKAQEQAPVIEPVAPAAPAVEQELPQAQSEQGQKAPEETNTAAELEALRAEIEALRASKKEVDASKPEQQAKEEAISFYESPEERQRLVEMLGDDVVAAQEKMFARALTAQAKTYEPKLTALEERNKALEKSQQSAAFIRAVGAEALKKFNDPTFQAIAKDTPTGYKRTLLDDLKQIVEGNDLDGAEYLKQQIGQYASGEKAVRKAQIATGKSPSATTETKAVYDADKANDLLRAIKKHRVGTPEHAAAVAAFDKYAALAQS